MHDHIVYHLFPKHKDNHGAVTSINNVCFECQHRRFVSGFSQLFNGFRMQLYDELWSESSLPHVSGEDVSLVCEKRVATQGLCSASVHLYAVPFLSDEMRREAYIIWNRYHSLMCLCSPWQPIMDHFWGSRHLVWLCDGDGMGTAGVTWEETRRTMGPFIYLSGSWHCKHLTWCAYRECLYAEWRITTRGEKKIALQNGNNLFFPLYDSNKG